MLCVFPARHAPKTKTVAKMNVTNVLHPMRPVFPSLCWMEILSSSTHATVQKEFLHVVVPKDSRVRNIPIVAPAHTLLQRHQSHMLHQFETQLALVYRINLEKLVVIV